MEYTGCGKTGHRGLKARVLVWCHLAQMSLRKVGGEHVLHCDGCLKGLALPYPGFEQKMLSWKLLSTTAAFVLYIVMLITNDKPGQNSL
jgi:hypothetical protein